MGVASKLKLYVTTGFLIAGTVGAMLAVRAVDKADDQEYLLEVEWKPELADHFAPVQISVLVNTVEVLSRKEFQSPWKYTLSEERDAVVNLVAYAPDGRTTSLHCRILKAGKTPRLGADRRTTPGWVSCHS